MATFPISSSYFQYYFAPFELYEHDADATTTILPEDDLAQPVQVPKDKILGDILPTGFDEKSCLSSYEALHKKCGPYTALCNKTMEDLKSGRYLSISDCKYLVWISFSGLGNRILTLASAFLYALLTDRVLLVDPGIDIPDLFCEPFPDVSWLLPLDFPLTSQFNGFNQKSRQRNCFPPLGAVSVPSYKFSVGVISRYYEAYLSKADVKVGIQIRVFDIETGPFKHVLDQILSCTMKEGILPQINEQEPIIKPSGKQKTVSVLMTSLSGGYFEEVRDLYWEHPTVTGDVIEVYQPSHEGHQQTEKQNHNRKAWAEMYLLSLTDKLATSSWSTFGYVAQGLGNLKPWILYKPENRTAPDPPCRRAASMEPCFHAPPFYDCKLRRGVDTGALVPHVKHCEDMSWGLKLVETMLSVAYMFRLYQGFGPQVVIMDIVWRVQLL
ncbi:UNVERIFIED_CONTAM: Galactoside 2-alpha-L-fucosyltransferase [Sesamum indicum]